MFNLSITSNFCILYNIIYLHLTPGIFYFTLGNVPPTQRSRLSSIHLVALLKEKHLKKYGMDLVLQPIVRDLKKLVSVTLT